MSAASQATVLPRPVYYPLEPAFKWKKGLHSCLRRKKCEVGVGMKPGHFQRPFTCHAS